MHGVPVSGEYGKPDLIVGDEGLGCQDLISQINAPFALPPTDEWSVHSAVKRPSLQTVRAGVRHLRRAGGRFRMPSRQRPRPASTPTVRPILPKFVARINRLAQCLGTRQGVACPVPLRNKTPRLGLGPEIAAMQGSSQEALTAFAVLNWTAARARLDRAPA